MAYTIIAQNNSVTTLQDDNGNIIYLPGYVTLASASYTIVEVNNSTATLEDGDGNILRDIPCVAVLAGEGGGGGSVNYNKVVQKANSLPTANSSHAGQVYMYTGTTNANYTHGYIYECQQTSGASATVSTDGSSWVDLAVDMATFVAKAEPTGDVTMNFEVTHADTPDDLSSVQPTWTGGTATLNASTALAKLAESFPKCAFELSQAVFTKTADGWDLDGNLMYYDGSETYTPIDTIHISDLSEYGITLGGTAPATDDTMDGDFFCYWPTVESGGSEVSLEQYGVTWGWDSVPAVGDIVTVTYVDGGVPTFAWVRQDVQPSDASTVVTISSATATQALASNTIYNCGEMTSLEITLPVSPDVKFVAQVNFTSGSTPTSFTAPNTMKWLGDDVSSNVFVPAASKRYAIMVYYDGVNMRGISQAVA